MRMKISRAAIKEYLRAATRMAAETRNSCHRTWALAHVSNPVNATARILSGSESSSSSPHLIFSKGGRFFFKSSPLVPLSVDPFSFSCFCSLGSPELLLFSAKIRNLDWNLGIFMSVCRGKKGKVNLSRETDKIGDGSERFLSPNMFLPVCCWRQWPTGTDTSGRRWELQLLWWGGHGPVLGIGSGPNRSGQNRTKTGEKWNQLWTRSKWPLPQSRL